jgi:hypothetical protein
MDATTGQELPLARARRRDTARRRLQVHNAIAEQITAGAEITVSSIARAARVHRSFIHRHQDLHAAVVAAAAVPAEPAANNGAVSVASLRADLLNARAPGRTGRNRGARPSPPRARTATPAASTRQQTALTGQLHTT